MSFTIAFYVHHHGSGHLMRCVQIASALKGYRIIFMGTGLQHVDPSIEVIDLPSDLPEGNEQDDLSSLQPDSFHYAPTGLKGIRERTAIMTSVFQRSYPMLLIVDVSVEVTLLARLCGIPTIVIRQHGIRTDLPHLLAYQSAELLLAPFSESLYRGAKDWAYQKTLFSGGFSRFDGLSGSGKEHRGHVGVLLGAGGTSIDIQLIEKIAVQAEGYTFHILGARAEHSSVANIQWHGKVENPMTILRDCGLLLGNTGHNTVMEVAALNKRFIGIPEERPFAEQEEKAAAIAERSGIRIIQPEDLEGQDWKNVFDELSAEQADWNGVIDKDALSNIAQAIIKTGTTLFNNQLLR